MSRHTFRIRRDEPGLFWVEFVAPNREVIWTTPTYPTKAQALMRIEAIQLLAADAQVDDLT